jgi:opacity protein-like surface antigen
MLTDRLIVGAELDFNRSGRFKRTFVYSGTSVTDVESRSEWLGMMMGRVGYALPYAPVLLVGEFGLYYSRTEVEQKQVTGANNFLTAGNSDVAHSNTISLIGGIGAELRMTEKVSFRVDALFSQSGKSFQTYDRRLLRDETNRVNARYVQVGLNYRF